MSDLLQVLEARHDAGGGVTCSRSGAALATRWLLERTGGEEGAHPQRQLVLLHPVCWQGSAEQMDRSKRGEFRFPPIFLLVVDSHAFYGAFRFRDCLLLLFFFFFRVNGVYRSNHIRSHA
jgi:hypothetical protein